MRTAGVAVQLPPQRRIAWTAGGELSHIHRGASRKASSATRRPRFFTVAMPVSSRVMSLSGVALTASVPPAQTVPPQWPVGTPSPTTIICCAIKALHRANGQFQPAVPRAADGQARRRPCWSRSFPWGRRCSVRERPCTTMTCCRSRRACRE